MLYLQTFVNIYGLYKFEANCDPVSVSQTSGKVGKNDFEIHAKNVIVRSTEMYTFWKIQPIITLLHDVL